VIKDIIKGVGCEEELKLTQDKVIKLESREYQKDTIISLLESKDKNNQYIITQQGLQMELFRDMTEGLKKDVRRANNKTFMYKFGMFLGVISTSYLLLVR